MQPSAFAMPSAYAAKEALLHDLQRASQLPLLLNDERRPDWLRSDFFLHPLIDLEGLTVAHLLAPPGHTTLLVRGEIGAHHQRVSLAQRVTLHVLAGALLWWQASWGADPRRVETGDVLTLDSEEEHGFVVLEPCLLYNILQPGL